MKNIFSKRVSGSPEDRNETESRGKKAVIRKFAAYVVAAGCLVWVFYDVNPSKLVQGLATLEWGWVVAAVVFDTLGYCSQALQWRLLLHPLGRIPFLKAAQAIYAGLFTNDILPMRAGELVRAFLVARWLSVDLFAAVPSVIIGRLFDGIWLVAGVGLTAAFIHLPQDLMEGAEILAAAVLAGIFLLLYIIYRRKETGLPDRIEKGSRHWLQAVGDLIGTMTQGMKTIGLTGAFYLSFTVSVFYLLFAAMAFWLGLKAYGIHLSLWSGAAAFLIVRLGTFVPNTPSNLGTLQFFTVFALSRLGVNKTDAAGFSVVIFFILTVPSLFIGLFAITHTGMKFRDIRREIRSPKK